MNVKVRAPLVEAFIADGAGKIPRAAMMEALPVLDALVSRWPTGATMAEVERWWRGGKSEGSRRRAVGRWSMWVAEGGPARAGLEWRWL